MDRYVVSWEDGDQTFTTKFSQSKENAEILANHIRKTDVKNVKVVKVEEVVA